MASDGMTDTFTANACLFLFTTRPSFPSVFSIVYATVKRQHIELCGVLIAYLAQYFTQLVTIS